MVNREMWIVMIEKRYSHDGVVIIDHLKKRFDLYRW